LPAPSINVKQQQANEHPCHNAAQALQASFNITETLSWHGDGRLQQKISFQEAQNVLIINAGEK
jgi:hypothetical protein